ncbi:metallophosphoesterase family protein [Paenibacillus aceris]|uniref:Calcineurin-like phosphoesterase domain-containing protein n=1 Tax=Paenibacillus aceris TaxID=869555 RepID=A0ABS4I102_9BACL|nr:metallophosphoesterase [Paenibacillus aceris]MBP1964570.1 hypothetical protein [Paenibacillus aceris]NHW35721.1 metallophosphoesterase [Paenibacillus aceris]
MKKDQSKPHKLPLLYLLIKSQFRRFTATQVINFAVMGDSHVGYQNGAGIFKALLPKAVQSGQKKFVIFGGDNKHGGSTSQDANAWYKEFKDIASGILNPKNIPFKASIGNWEDNTRDLFKHYLGSTVGQMNMPGTKGKVKHVWLDNAPGKFSDESIALLKSLDPNFSYVIDFHWPLRVQGIGVDLSHVLSRMETDRFFNAIPGHVRNNILAIFTHHAHAWYEKTSPIYPGFTKTKFYVCGCSGAYKCTTGNSGYYDASLIIKNNQIDIHVMARKF